MEQSSIRWSPLYRNFEGVQDSGDAHSGYFERCFRCGEYSLCGIHRSLSHGSYPRHRLLRRFRALLQLWYRLRHSAAAGSAGSADRYCLGSCGHYCGAAYTESCQLPVRTAHRPGGSAVSCQLRPHSRRRHRQRDRPDSRWPCYGFHPDGNISHVQYRR